MSTRATVELPIELILLATEYAAWDDLDEQMQTSETAIRHWRQWIASLCTVCRAFEPAMARILYTLVHVYPSNLGAVLRAAEMDTHPLRRARAVYFDPRGTPLADEQTSALSAAFQHVHAYTGLLDDLRPLFNERIHPHDLRPLSMHFTRSTDVFNMNIITISAERLHLELHSLSNWIGLDQLSRFRTRFLILDILMYNSMLAATLSKISRYQKLERVLIRSKDPWNRSVTQALQDEIRSFAVTTRNALIWFDDSFHPSSSTRQWAYRYLYDAMTGDDLWLRGSQLYVPGTDA